MHGEKSHLAYLLVYWCAYRWQCGGAVYLCLTYAKPPKVAPLLGHDI